MIRILQQDNRVTKAIFALVIGAAIITMVITLVPGIFDTNAASDATVFATVRNPGLLGKLSGDTSTVTMDEVRRQTDQQMRRQNLPPFYAQFLMTRVGQQQVEREVLVREADRLGLGVSDEDLRHELQKGPLAEYIFPNGQYIGDDHYMAFVEQNFGVSVQQFEHEVKEDLEIQRLQALVTAGVSVSDAAVRAEYMKQGTKVKFDYASISADDIKKTINPSDTDLQAFFKQNSARYATAVPETRKLQFFAFSNSDIPGGKPQVSDAQVQSYYTQHATEFNVPEEVKTRHILITVAKGADAATDAAAKAKAADLLKQIKGGANFAELAKKNSQDPGSKDSGGELPMIPTSSLDPAYAKAAMALNPGQTSDVVRSQFGYHIIQTEAKQAAHAKPLAEVKDQIAAQLSNQAAGSAAQNYATSLANEAKAKGMAATAAAHNLHLETTDYIGHDATIGTLADATQLMQGAFSASKNAAPQTASTGEGYAIFQVLDIKPAHAPDFAAWKSHVADDYREQKAPELLNDQLNKLSSLAKQYNDLHKAAAELKIPVKSSDLVGRDSQVSGLGAMSGPASAAFDLPKGGISGPINTGASGAVLQVTDKQEPTPDEVAKNLATTRDKLLQQQQQQAFAVFAGELMQRYEKAGAIVYSKKGLPGGPFGG